MDILGQSMFPFPNTHDSDGTSHGSQIADLNGKRPLDSDDVVVESDPEDELGDLLTPRRSNASVSKQDTFYMEKLSAKRQKSKNASGISSVNAKSTGDHQKLFLEMRQREHEQLMEIYDLEKKAKQAELLYWQTRNIKDNGISIVCEIDGKPLE